jgi:hypothetical protein
MDKIEKFEFHYYLNDDSHSMDALIQNKCEAEILAIAYEAIVSLELSLTINSEALREGGLREIWTVIGKNSAQIALVISVITLVLSQVPKKNSELEDLQKEEARLSIEEKKLTIEKLKKDLGKKEVSQNSILSGVKIVNHNYKIVTRKSNLYKLLENYQKVTKIGVSTLDIKNQLISKEQIVDRELFSRFILASNNLKPVIVEDAIIEIVSPVIKDRKAKWKGIYQGKMISFSMDDKEFKREVLSKNVSFTNGAGIICVLKIYKKLNEVGEVVTSGYSVDTVLENQNSDISLETKQGKTYRFVKKQKEGQGELFKNNNS